MHIKEVRTIMIMISSLISHLKVKTKTQSKYKTQSKTKTQKTQSKMLFDKYTWMIVKTYLVNNEYVVYEKMCSAMKDCFMLMEPDEEKEFCTLTFKTCNLSLYLDNEDGDKEMSFVLYSVRQVFHHHQMFIIFIHFKKDEFMRWMPKLVKLGEKGVCRCGRKFAPKKDELCYECSMTPQLRKRFKFY